MNTNEQLAIIPDRLLFSARRAITQAAGCQMTAEANAIIQATLDYLTAQYAAQAAPAAPVAVPLTDEEKLKMLGDSNQHWSSGKREWYLQGVEDADLILAARWGVKLEGGE